jgi:hypothetical protein
MDNQESEYLTRPDARGHLKVLEVLRQWDPIGVVSEKNQDEYDALAPRLVRLLDARCTPKELARELYRIKTKEMGLCGFWLMSHEKKIARELVEWWDEWKDSQQNPPCDVATRATQED